MVAYLAVVTALDKKAAEREMTSHLLADMYEALLNEQQFEAAISQLLQDLPDLTLDCPGMLFTVMRMLRKRLVYFC